MDYLTKYYKNLSEQLQARIDTLQKYIEESIVTTKEEREKLEKRMKKYPKGYEKYETKKMPKKRKDNDGDDDRDNDDNEDVPTPDNRRGKI